MAKITINGISVDPQLQVNELSAAKAISPDSADSNYILIQTKQPLNRDQREQLAALDVQLIEYVPTNAYICYYAAADLAAVRALPFVEWANVYLRGFKIAPQLAQPAGAANSANLLAVGAPKTSMAQEPRRVEVVLHRNASANDVRDKIAAAARLDPEDLKVSNGKIRLTVRPQYLGDLAAVDEVRHIEEVVPPKLFNNVALGIIRATETHATAGFEGHGQVVTVCDTGFDKGSLTDVHAAFTGRVLKLYSLGRSKANDPDGHGTHVAGSVLGDGHSAAMGGPIRGTAPQASLVLQSVFDSNGNLGGLPDDLTELFRVPYEDDAARIHTNSWGAPAAGKYTQNAYEVDDFVWNHRDFVVCFAAGNEGTDADGDGVINSSSVGSPGTAKNCITVGACESFRPAISKPYGAPWPQDYPVDPIASDPWANNPDGMAAFSSRGPTFDGRIKPDVVAPGTAILSTRSRDANVGSFWGASSDQLYCFMGGTSMATPLVAGCVAVVREYFQRQYEHLPSAALVKAMLINGATDISGQYVPSEAGAIPNLAEGFGRIDLAATVGPYNAGEQVIFRDEDLALDTDEEELSRVVLDEAGRLLKVTLVWTDPPGESLQNDLDLIVRAANGAERHGNMPVNASDFDRKNNVEQVVWPDAPSGNVEIVVRAHRITLQPQSYALVIRIS